MSDGHALQRVELVEDDALALGPAPGDGRRLAHADGTGPAPSRRRRARWLVAAVGVVGLLGFAVVGAQAALDSGYEDRVAARAALPGAVEPMRPRLQVRWSTEAVVMDSLLLDRPVGGAYLGARAVPDGSVQAVALDSATGGARWTTSLRGGLGEDAVVPGSGRGCTTATTPDAPVDALVCVVVYRAHGQHESDPAERAEVVALDATTGTVLARHAAPTQAGRVVVLGDQAVVAWRAFGTVNVHAQDLLTGAARWQTRLSVPRSGILTVGSLRDAPRIGRVQLAAGGGVVVVGAAQQVFLLTPSGDLREGTGRLDGYVRQVRADRVVVLTVHGSAGTLVVRSGADDVHVPHVVALPTLDDGSLADLVLTVEAGLRGYDRTSGALRWALDGRDSGTIVLDGTVYQSGDAALVRAVDGRSGRELWAVPAPRAAYVTDLVTDGERLYVALHGLVGSDKTWRVYGFDGLDEGTLEAPAGWRGLEIRGRVLVATSTDASRAAVLG